MFPKNYRSNIHLIHPTSNFHQKIIILFYSTHQNKPTELRSISIRKENVFNFLKLSGKGSSELLRSEAAGCSFCSRGCVLPQQPARAVGERPCLAGLDQPAAVLGRGAGALCGAASRQRSHLRVQGMLSGQLAAPGASRSGCGGLAASWRNSLWTGF